ncbi:MAG: hypothetical protein ACLR17_07135 [Enterobacteriaceae bacterium]
MLGVVYGAVIVSFGLSFWQAILAAVAGVASFALVGITSIAGKIGRTTTLTLSASFLANAVISPHQLLLGESDGLEAVNIITGTLTLVALFAAMGLEESLTTTALSLFLFGGLTVLVSVLGQNAVLMMQKWITRIFGAMTLLVVIYLLFTARTGRPSFALPSGSWLTGFLPAVSIIAAGTGIIIAGADYSRDQRPDSRKSLFFSPWSAAPPSRCCC